MGFSADAAERYIEELRGTLRGVETEAESPFVPPCTKRVFLKYYSASYSENNYWTKNDAEQYKQDIQMCINKL